MTQAPKYDSPWIPLEGVPEPLTTRFFVTEPLGERHAELDYQAVISYRDRLQRELQWGDWPPENFTLEENRADLRRHHEEFLRGEAFAYTVLSPDRTKCLGCFYVERCVEIEGAQLAFWLIDEKIDIEGLLLSRVLRWLRDDWSIQRIVLPFRDENTRGIEIAEGCGFTPLDFEEGPLAEHRCYVSVDGKTQSSATA